MEFRCALVAALERLVASEGTETTLNRLVKVCFELFPYLQYEQQLWCNVVSMSARSSEMVARSYNHDPHSNKQKVTIARVELGA
jgi:hypothetical protein